MSTNKKNNGNHEMLFDGMKGAYDNNCDRQKSADGKLNMILVFNASIIVALGVVLPFDKTPSYLFTLSIVFFSCLMLSMIVGLSLITFGIFPRKNLCINTDSFVEDNNFDCDKQDLIKAFIAKYKDVNVSLSKNIEIKYLCCKISMVCAIISIAMLIALIVVKTIGG